jgi:Spy/CpxP family protein refolding chaperone
MQGLTGSALKPLTDAIDKLELTDDQKSKIADLKKEYEPKFKDFHEKMVAVLTDDQKKTLEDGKKKIADATDQQERRQATQDLMTSLKITDDQRTKMGEVGTDMRPVMQEARTKFLAVLTDEQKAKLPPMVTGGGRGGRGGRNRGGNGGNGGNGGGSTQSREST